MMRWYHFARLHWPALRAVVGVWHVFLLRFLGGKLLLQLRALSNAVLGLVQRVEQWLRFWRCRDIAAQNFGGPQAFASDGAEGQCGLLPLDLERSARTGKRSHSPLPARRRSGL